MACDICGKTGTTLIDLLSQYQEDDVKYDFSVITLSQ